MSVLWVLVGVFLRDIIKWIPTIKRKWIKGECRHFCCLCKFYDEYCKYDLGVDKEYVKGFDDGYKTATDELKSELHKDPLDDSVYGL